MNKKSYTIFIIWVAFVVAMVAFMIIHCTIEQIKAVDKLNNTDTNIIKNIFDYIKIMGGK